MLAPLTLVQVLVARSIQGGECWTTELTSECMTANELLAPPVLREWTRVRGCAALELVRLNKLDMGQVREVLEAFRRRDRARTPRRTWRERAAR